MWYNTAMSNYPATVPHVPFTAAAVVALLSSAFAEPLPQVGDGETLTLERRTYHLREEDTTKVWLDPSNNGSGEKSVALLLTGRRDITVDGNGATLVCHGRTFPFAARGCKGVTFRNFTVTTQYPSCAGLTVLEKADDGFTVRFDDGVCPFEVKDGNVEFRLDGHVVSTRDGRLSLHALDRIAIHYLMTPDAPGDKDEFPATFVGVRAERLDGRRVRFAYCGDRHPKSVKCPYAVGERVVVNLEERRYREVFFFEDCEGVRVEGVTIRRFGGMGVVAQRSGDIAVERLKALPPDGERVTLTADIMQFVNCHGKLTVADCDCGDSLDDVINIHGNYLRVEKAAGRKVTLRAMHKSHEGFFPYRRGDALEFVNARTRAVLAKAAVVGVVPSQTDRFVCEVEVDAEVGAVPVGALVENATLNPEVTIRGNDFHDFPHMRVSGRGRYLIEGNRFTRCMGAVVGMDLAEYWYESGRISEMVIRGNAFTDCNALGGRAFLSFGVSGWGGDAPKIHGRVVLEGNAYKGVRAQRHSVAGVREFVER